MPQNEIMIVDDNPANLKLLENMLVGQGHEVCAFRLGRLALAAAAADPPGLILLDIDMPEMNGYEVCERLKSNGRLSGIPIIFLSALSETQDKVRAFQSGAADYISKPFQFEEVHARVETHLSLHALRCALELRNDLLEQAVASRTCELSAALERVTLLDRSKSDFLKLISHELRTPLNGVLGVGEIILSSAPATEENLELQGLYNLSRQRLLSLLDDALLFTQIDVSGQRFKLSAISLHAAVVRALEYTAAFAASRSVLLKLPAFDMGFVSGNEELLSRALHALVETAVKFSEQEGTVRLAGSVGPDTTEIIVESFGTAIHQAHLTKFFDLFSIDETLIQEGDLGVRPALAHRILSLFGGSVSVANLDRPVGIRLTATLRRA